MSGLFWVTTYTVVLVLLFLVARPLLGDKIQQSTPAILGALLTPLLVIGLHKYFGVSNVAVADSSSEVSSLTSPAAVPPKLNREQISAAELPFELLYSDDCVLVQGLQVQRTRKDDKLNGYFEICTDLFVTTEQDIIAGR